MNSVDAEISKPEVVYLRAVFRKIDQGKIRVPNFQRNIVWKEDQIIKLLDSIYRGYPIGSVLLWEVQDKQLEIDVTKKLPFPVLNESYPTSYILDGLQRLTALYGVFHSNGVIGECFFDLKNEEFFMSESEEKLSSNELEVYNNKKQDSISLLNVFSPNHLLQEQARLFQRPNGIELVKNTSKVQTAFHEYLIPIVSINGRKTTEVVEIFERINSTGTKLSRVDFMRAMTWSKEFDLNKELTDISNLFESYGYKVPAETTVKLIGMCAGLDPTGDGLYGLKSINSESLLQATSTLKDYFFSVKDFLHTENIFSYNYLPYEGQLLIIFRCMLLTDKAPDQKLLNKLSWWTRNVSLHESLRGKPDHYVHRYIKHFEGFILRGEELPNIFNNVINIDTVMTRRFTINKAFSAAIALAFIDNKPCDLLTSKPIVAKDFMATFDSKQYMPVILKSKLKKVVERVTSDRIVSNTIMTSSYELSEYRYIVDNIETIDPKVLESQFINEGAVCALKRGDYLSFLEIRSALIVEKLNGYLNDQTLSKGD